MNQNPEQPGTPNTPGDEAFDDALLAQAAQPEHSPEALEQLQARVLGLTDPRLMSLLDEALAPEADQDAAAGDALADRIIAATTPDAALMPRAQTAGSADNPPAVIGRIGIGSYAAAIAAIAAILALAAGVGLWWASQQTETTDNRHVELAPDNNQPNKAIANNDNDPGQPGMPDETNWPATDETYAAGDDVFADVTASFEQAFEEFNDAYESLSLDDETLWPDSDAYDELFSDSTL